MKRIRYYIELLRRLIKRRLGLSLELVWLGAEDVGKRQIINPKATSSPHQIITPRQYTVTYKDALTEVREYDYINPRLSYKHITGRGER